jgi:enoyl-CoA hydratase
MQKKEEMKPVEFNNVLFEIEKPIAIITINRPKALNALNEETLRELDVLVDQIAANHEIQAVIITGQGNAFVAGADIAAMQNKSVLESRVFAQMGQQVMMKIERLEQPVIAAVNGYALGGGCELAMACDLRIASEKAKFGQPEVGLGIFPGFGGTQRMPRLVGAGKAKELILTGDTIDAAGALAIGLVNHVVAPEELMAFCKALAQRMTSKAPLAVRMAKQAINEGLQVDIDRGMTIEQDLFGFCFSTQDQREGMTAFLEKRKPEFQGK